MSIQNPTPGQRLLLRLYAEFEPYLSKAAAEIAGAQGGDIPLMVRPLLGQAPKMLDMLRRRIVLSIMNMPEERIRLACANVLRFLDARTPAIRAFVAAAPESASSDSGIQRERQIHTSESDSTTISVHGEPRPEGRFLPAGSSGS